MAGNETARMTREVKEACIIMPGGSTRQCEAGQKQIELTSRESQYGVCKVKS